MKKLAKLTMLIAFSFFVFNSTMAQVSADYDKSVDFSKYQTYSFAGWQDDSDKLLNDLDKDRMRNAFQEEFAARNMKISSDNADAVVTLYLVVDNKTSTTAYTNYTGGMGYGAGRGWGMGVGGMGFGSSTTTYSENDYKQGTLVVDVYDASTSKLIWQGISQSTVQEKASKRDKSIPKKVSKLMKKYPIDPVK